MSSKPFILDAPHRSLEAHITVRLTEKELHVLEMIVAGKQNKEIAWEMHISVRTAKAYAERLYHKLGVTGLGRAGLAATALRNGLVK